MGRTQLERTIAELRTNIEQCKNHKKKILQYAEDLKKNCITLSQYEILLTKKIIDGKTIPEWLKHYDNYIKECEKEIKKIERKSFGKKLLSIILPVVIISILILSAFYLTPIFVGFVTQEKFHTQTLNLEFTKSMNHELVLEGTGYLDSVSLDSVKLSGTIEGEGDVRIYFDDFLILDSSKNENIKLTGKVIEKTDGENLIISFFKDIFSKITGRAAEEITRESSEKSVSEPVQKKISEEIKSEDSYSEEIEEAPQTQSPSQEEPPLLKYL